MIIGDDNSKYDKWIDECNLVFKIMNIDISTIPIYFLSQKESEMWSSYRYGKCVKMGRDYYIYIASNLDHIEFINCLSHEVGHATQMFGYAGGRVGFITDAIAIKFQEMFLIFFNNHYNTNIPLPVAEDFSGYKYKVACYIKKITPLITLRYKLPSPRH